MLKPSMKELLSKVGNRYLLVNLPRSVHAILPRKPRKRGSNFPRRPFSWRWMKLQPAPLYIALVLR